MNTHLVLKETWLSRHPHPRAYKVTLFCTALLSVASFLYLRDLLQADAWMAATPRAVFGASQSWRAWTTLFAHGDLGHLVSNLMLFVPFCYFLSGYFGPYLPLLLAFFVGGLTNLIVLKTLAADVALIGVSGVVYWMAATWFTLYVLIERRESWRRRLGKVLIVSMILFLPETYKPEISYLSHFVGYALGIPSALIIYGIRRQDFRRAEKHDLVIDDDDDLTDPAIEAPRG